ncbi:hypothetical protein K0U07_01425 [bacterium]|nr:hypothetical protein [bacterium]
MGEVRNIDSAPDPRKKAGEGDAVNPDKFQKALRVEKADETDKREKRNRPKKEEELEDEQDEVGASIPVPNGLFKEYMSEEEKKASALDGGKGSSVRFVSDGKEGSSSASSKGVGYIPEIEEEASSPSISIETNENVSSKANFAEDDSSTTPSNLGENTPPPPSAPAQSANAPEGGYSEEINAPPTEDTQNTDQASGQPSSDKTQKKKKSKKADHTGKKEKTDHTTKKESVKKGKEATKKEGKEPTAKKTPSTKSESKQTPPTKDTPVKEVREEKAHHTSTKGKVEQKKAEKSADKDDPTISGPKEIEEQKSDHQDHEQGNEEEVVANADTVMASPTGVAALQMSPFANIPKDVFTLFEKMVGMMQVSKDNGKSITTVKLNMPNSVFDKCELVLEHYDTAPNNYTVQFLGNPQAVERFSSNLPALNNAIAESKLTFSIHLPPPKLLKTYASPVSSLEKEKGDKDEENDREEKQR